MQPGLSCKNVSVVFGGVRALDQVNFTLSEGEIVGLIGPNGAGKSTLVNVITGFQATSEGSVSLDGIDLIGVVSHRRAHAGITRTFQSVRLFSGLSVFENLVASALGKPGTSVSNAFSQASEVAGVLNLNDYLESDAISLPHGVERLVGIGRALASQPRFLLLDEPAAGLNETESDELGRVLTNIRDRYGCGICVIEHDMRLIMSVSERINVLDSGALIAEGTASQIQRNDRVIEAYLGVAHD
ncbi:MAG: ABC transporter ATP-binding protein [Actinomycetes bacterium]|jgi:branched-chain amino acid transport system ATP-binding protein